MPEQLDIRRIAEARQSLQAALSAAGNAAVLDCSAVTRIDTAGVQLLAAALNGPAGKQVTLGDASPCVLEAFEALGLDHFFNPSD